MASLQLAHRFLLPLLILSAISLLVIFLVLPRQSEPTSRTVTLPHPLSQPPIASVSSEQPLSLVALEHEIVIDEAIDEEPLVIPPVAPVFFVPLPRIDIDDYVERSTLVDAIENSVQRQFLEYIAERVSEHRVVNDVYALQLLGSHSKEAVLQFIKQYQLDEHASYYQTQLDDEDWFVLLYGRYPSAAAAQAAVDGLPVAIQQLRPWARQIKSISP